MRLIDPLLMEFDRECSTTRKLLERVPEGKNSWQPHPKSMTSVRGTPMFSMPRLAVVRSFILNHSIHHRGQLSVYLRLLDVPLPPIYGPTADENPFG